MYASKIAREMACRARTDRARLHRGPAPRRRQDRRPRRVITKPDRLTRRGVRGDQAPSRDRREDPRAGRVPRATWRRACATTTSGSTAPTRGYPDRLRGDQIPLPSRIILVADTVEAMTSDRPYRKALAARDGGLASSTSTRARQFDPNVRRRLPAPARARGRVVHQEGPEVRHLRVPRGLSGGARAPRGARHRPRREPARRAALPHRPGLPRRAARGARARSSAPTPPRPCCSSSASRTGSST